MICSYWGQQAEVQVVLVFRHSAPPRSSKTLTLTGFQGSNINLTRDDIDLKSGSGVAMVAVVFKAVEQWTQAVMLQLTKILRQGRAREWYVYR